MKSIMERGGEDRIIKSRLGLLQVAGVWACTGNPGSNPPSTLFRSVTLHSRDFLSLVRGAVGLPFTCCQSLC